MKKYVAIGLTVFLFMGIFLSGCGSKTDQPAEKLASDAQEQQKSADTAADKQAENVTIQYTIWSDEESYLKTVIDEFNKLDAAVQVKYTVIPNDEYDDKIKVLLSGGEDIDILGVRGIQQLNQYVGGGALAKLSEMIEKNNVDVNAFGPMYQKSMVDGIQYGLPYRNSCWFLIYNKDIFDKEGIPYPTQMTYDQFAELAKKLTKGEGASKQWGAYVVDWVLNMLAIQRGVTLLDDDVSALKESLEFLNRVYTIDKSAMSAAEMKTTKSNWIAEFEKGNVAMMPNGDWFIGMIKADEKAGKSTVNWDLAPLPVPEGVEPGTSFGHYTYVALTEAGKNKEQAFKYAQFLCGENGAAILAEAGILPAYNSQKVKESYVKSAGKESVSVIFSSKVLDEQPFHPKGAEVAEVFKEESELYLYGEKDIDTAMADFVKRRAEVLGSN